MSRILEIRIYTLKPGTRPELERLMAEQSLPMLARWKIDVVRCGGSLHDENGYYLIRSYADMDERQRSEEAFYGSAEWRDGPREAALALIEGYAETIIEVDDAAVDALRG